MDIPQVEQLAKILASELSTARAPNALRELTNFGDHLLWQTEIDKSPYGKFVLGHGSKDLEGFSRLLHGLGDESRGFHSAPFGGDRAALGAGLGASRPYLGPGGPLGFMFANTPNNPKAAKQAIGIWVDPRLGPKVMQKLRDYVPQEIPVISADQIATFINKHGPQIAKGTYTGKKVDLFARLVKALKRR